MELDSLFRLIRGRNWSPAPGPAPPGPAASIGPRPVVAAGTGPAQVPAHLQRS